ncbi:unnamed protein product [Lampetra fluviatilis]
MTKILRSGGKGQNIIRRLQKLHGDGEAANTAGLDNFPQDKNHTRRSRAVSSCNRYAGVLNKKGSHLEETTCSLIRLCYCPWSQTLARPAVFACLCRLRVRGSRGHGGGALEKEGAHKERGTVGLVERCATIPWGGTTNIVVVSNIIIDTDGPSVVWRGGREEAIDNIDGGAREIKKPTSNTKSWRFGEP